MRKLNILFTFIIFPLSCLGAECVDPYDKANRVFCIDPSPLVVYSKYVTKTLFGGSVIMGSGSWQKEASVDPENKKYRISGSIDITTEDLYLNEPDYKKYTTPYKDLQTPSKMPIEHDLTLEEWAPIPSCKSGTFFIIFDSANKVICSELECHDGESDSTTHIKAQLKCGWVSTN